LHKILGNVLVSHAAEREAEQAREVGLEQLVECPFVAPQGACDQGLIVVHRPLLRLRGSAKSFGWSDPAGKARIPGQSSLEALTSLAGDLPDAFVIPAADPTLAADSVS
jgi:hypothetical protein